MTKRNPKTKTETGEPKKSKAKKNLKIKRYNRQLEKRSGLDLARMTQEYFYPDILDGKLEKIKIPTIRELAFLGNLNVSRIRAYYRHEGDKLAKMQRNVRHDLAVLEQRVSALEQQPGCDWHGYGYARIPMTESAELSPAEWRRECERRSKLVDSCRFGREVASWCERVPCSRCDRQCGQMCTAAPMVGIIGGASPQQLREIAEHLSQGPEEGLCQFYDVCHSNQPFQDEACVLADPQMQNECRQFLHRRLDELKRRHEILRKYMHNLTLAESHCDQHYELPEFFEEDNYSGSGRLEMLVILKHIDGQIVWNVGFRQLAKPDPDGKKPIIIQDVESWPDVIITREIKVSAGEAGKIYLSANDFLYLAQDKRFRQVWLEMSDFRAKAFSKEELAEFFAQFDDAK